MKRQDFKDYARIPEPVSQAYIRAVDALQEEPMKKRKVSTALVVALVLMLAAFTALAAVLLSGRDFVEEVMRPMAQENASESWTEEEVSEILRVARENGLQLNEDQEAQLLARGGYYKEEMMRLFMKLGLGDDPSTWSIEDQAWYGQMLIDIGLYEVSSATLPEEGEATEAQMLAAVQARVSQFDPQAPITDEAVYRRHTTYQWTALDDDGTMEKQWYVVYEPLDLTHASYRFTLDTGANILYESVTPGIAAQAEQPTPEALRYRYTELYGSFYDWTMETWVEFQPMLRAAVAAHGVEREEALELIAHSDFALPAADALSKEAAMEAATQAILAKEGVGQSALRPDKAYAVYLLGEETPVWKVTVPAAAEGDYLVEVGAQTGEAQSIQFAPYGVSSIARSFVLESVYQAQEKALPAGTLRFANRGYQAVEPLPDGGFVLVGSAWRADGTTQAWAARVNAQGQTLWEVLYDEGRVFSEAVWCADGTLLLAMEPQKGEWFSLAVVTLDGNGQMLSGPILLKDRGWAYKGKDCLLVAKDYEGSGTRPSTLMAVNAKGQILWDHTYDELTGAGYHPHAAEDGYLLSGGAQGYPYDQQSGIWGLMARLDDQGNLLWTSRMEDYPQTGISAYLETADGGMFGAGMYYGKYEEDAEDYQKLSDFVVRFDADGNVLWCRYYPEINPVQGILSFELLPAPEDGVLMLARSLDGNEWYLVHLDGEGAVQGQWQPQFAVLDNVREGAFTAGGQSYITYCSRAEYEGATGPINTYVMPVRWPASAAGD